MVEARITDEVAGELCELVVFLADGVEGGGGVEFELAALDSAVHFGALVVGGTVAEGEDVGGTVGAAVGAFGGPMTIEDVVGGLFGDGSRREEAATAFFINMDGEDCYVVFPAEPVDGGGVVVVVCVFPVDGFDSGDDGGEA